MAYKPNYSEDYLSTLADYVTKQDDDGSDEMTGLASSFASQTASNVFTGTLTYGANIMKDYYKDYSQQMNFKDAFTGTVDMYVEQASLAKQNAESVVQKAWEEQRVANELAAEQAKGTLKEQYTLGTGQMAIGKAQLENIAKRQAIEIDLTASETLFEAWSNIDEQAASLISMTAQDYQKFITTANSIESEMWQLFLNKFGPNYAGVLGEEIDGIFTPKYTDYSTQWYTALEDIGIIDRVTGTYTDFGKSMISYILDNPEDIIGFKEFIKTSDLGDFYISNSKFMREQLFDLSSFDAESYYESRETTFKESDYRMGTEYDTLSKTERANIKGTYQEDIIKMYGKDFIGEKSWGGLGKYEYTVNIKTANELDLSNETRNAIDKDIVKGSLVPINNKLYVYMGDGTFVKSTFGNTIWANMDSDKRGADVGKNIKDVKDLDTYHNENYPEYKYVYTYTTGAGVSYYIFSNIYYGEVGSKTKTLNTNAPNAKYERIR